MIVALIGLMGSGKTTVGSILAQRMGYEFLDLDQIIAEGEGLCIADIFALKSEVYFRRLERFYLQGIFTSSHLVLATGGGTPAFEDNMKQMIQNTTTVYLETDIASLLFRLKENNTERPLIRGMSEQQMELKLYDLLQSREQFYRQAQYIISTTNKLPEEIADEIIASLSHASR